MKNIICVYSISRKRSLSRSLLLLLLSFVSMDAITRKSLKLVELHKIELLIHASVDIKMLLKLVDHIK